MTEMTDEHKFACRIVATIVAGIVLLACVVATGIIVNNYVAMKQGYELVPTQVPMGTGVQWQKVK